MTLPHEQRTTLILKIVLTVVVTVVWSMSMILDFLSLDYEPSPFIHAAFIPIIGSIFGIGIGRK